MAIAPRAQRGGTSAPGQSAPSLPANFGQGQNITDDILRLTGAVANYTAQVRGRQDTIEAARIRQQFSEFSQAELVRLSSEQDFSREETFNAYKASLINRKRDLITNAPLTGNGRAKVDAELTNILGVGVAEAAQMRVAEQNRVVATALNQQMGEIMASISADPSAPLTDRLLQVDDLIRGYAPALTPEKEAALRTAATGQVVEAYMQPLIEAADTEGLRTMLDDPTVRNALGQEQYRTLSTQLRVQEVAKAQEAAKRAATMERLRGQGVDITNPRLIVAAEGFNPSEVYPSAPALSGKPAEMEYLMSKGATLEEAAALVYPETEDTSGGLKGQNQRLMTYVGDAALNTPPGVAPPLDYSQVASAFTLASVEARGVFNQGSGTWTPGTIPVSLLQAAAVHGVTRDMIVQDPNAAAVEFARRAGIPIPVALQARTPGQASSAVTLEPSRQGGPPIPQIGAAPPPAAPMAPAGQAPMAPAGQVGQAPVAPDAPLAARVDTRVPGGEEFAQALGSVAPLFSAGSEDEARELGQRLGSEYSDAIEFDGTRPAPSFNLSDAAPFITGPVDAVRAFFARYVPFRDPSEAESIILSARTAAEFAFLGMVNGMRQSPRFAVSEYQDLVKRLEGLAPNQIFANPGAYRAELKGASDFMLARRKKLLSDIEEAEENRRTGRDTAPGPLVAQNKAFVQDLEFAIQMLGVHTLDGKERPAFNPVVEGGLPPELEAEKAALEAELRAKGLIP